MELACKDMGLAYKLGKDLNVPLPLHSLVEQMMQQARLRYGNESGKYVQITFYDRYKTVLYSCISTADVIRLFFAFTKNSLIF